MLSMQKVVKSVAIAGKMQRPSNVIGRNTLYSNRERKVESTQH